MTGRFRPSKRLTTAVLTGVIVALLGFLLWSGAVSGAVTLSKLWSVAGLLVIILVTAATGVDLA